jgi:superfamily II DNA or RNA helicase
MDGWQQDLAKFLPGAKIGIIKGDKCDYEDKDVVLCMVQSASQKQYPRKIFDSFGLAVFDECHHMAAKTFCKVFEKVGSKFKVGLSATPDRTDNVLNNVLNWNLGPIVVREKRVYDGVLCSIIYYTHKNQREISYGDKIQYAKMVSRCCKEQHRNEFIASKIIDVFLNPTPLQRKRKILVISERSIDKHLKALQECIIKKFKQYYVLQYNNNPLNNKNISDKDFTETKVSNMKKDIHVGNNQVLSLGFLSGDTKKDERAIVNTCDVIMSSFCMVEEGFNLPSLDTLVICCCMRKDIEQTVGRILRPCPSKNIPMVIEIADNYSFFKGLASRHVAYYRKQQYQVQEIQYNCNF